MKRQRPAVKLTLSPDAHRLFRERAKEAKLPRSQYLENLLRFGRPPVHVPPGVSATLTLEDGCSVVGAVFEGGGFGNIKGGKITGGLHPAYRGPDAATSGERDANFKRGVEAAADVAAGYNSSTTHDYRLDDCILCKLNQTNRQKPRKNKHRLENPEHAAVGGLATALAAMLRLVHDVDAVCTVARANGVTIDDMRQAGTGARDLRELKKAGVA